MKSLFYYLQEITTEKQQASLIMLDPHGDISSELLALRLNLKNPSRLWYIDPYLDTEKIPCINPFWDKITDPILVDLLSQQWAKAFCELIPETGLTLQMQTILKPCLSVLFEKGECGLTDLQHFMDDTQNKQLVISGTQSTNVVFRNFFESAFLDKKYSTTKLAIYTRLQYLLNNYRFYQMMNGPCSIDLKKAMLKGKIVLFNLSKWKLWEDTSKALGKFISATILSIALQRAFQGESSRKACYLFSDEFQNQASSSMETIFCEARKYCLYLIVWCQSITQLEPSLREMVLNNTAIKLVWLNGLPALKAQALDIGVALSELQKLPSFHFYLKYDHHPAIKILSPSFLIHNTKSYFALPKELESIKEYCLNQSGIYRDNKSRTEQIPIKREQLPPDENLKTYTDTFGDFAPKFKL